MSEKIVPPVGRRLVQIEQVEDAECRGRVYSLSNGVSMVTYTDHGRQAVSDFIEAFNAYFAPEIVLGMKRQLEAVVARAQAAVEHPREP